MSLMHALGFTFVPLFEIISSYFIVCKIIKSQIVFTKLKVNHRKKMFSSNKSIRRKVKRKGEFW